MGVIGLRVEEFRAMTPEEFDAVGKAYKEMTEQNYRDGWEQMRILGCICVQPHLKKRIAPKDLIKYPWDDKPKDAEKMPIMSKEESMRQYRELMERLNEQSDGETNKI